MNDSLSKQPFLKLASQNSLKNVVPCALLFNFDKQSLDEWPFNKLSVNIN